jgi:hypothetical protein
MHHGEELLWGSRSTLEQIPPQEILLRKSRKFEI